MFLIYNKLLNFPKWIDQEICSDNNNIINLIYNYSNLFNPNTGSYKITYPYSTKHFINIRCKIFSRQIGLPNSQQHNILKAHFLHFLTSHRIL